ncbi:hypothetical protein [Thermodesulfovibrio yellowstonii]|uniref:hypothetical protein n=1 Tax=Thermodesulfovibrio yellowstonii TaxID=28262 RepID=UPI0003F6A75A|nr:hypothetical protein [Thermodesulfovibrio islandicus]
MYYSGNKLYQFFKNSQKFQFSTGTMWELVYGDNNANPLLLTLLVGDISEKYDLKQEEEAYSRLQYVSEKSKVPLIKVRFKTDTVQKNEVFFLDKNVSSKEKKISLDELKEVFTQYGLQVQSSSAKKDINFAVASSFHDWQRHNIGSNVTVSDIDLWLVDLGIPKMVFEVKRSKVSIESWTPYKDDYPNFILISKLCNKADMKFKLVYYYMKSGENRQEDISKLKIFNIVFDGKQLAVDLDKIISLEEFVMSGG